MYYVSVWKIELKDGYIYTDDHSFVEHDVEFHFYENAIKYVIEIERELEEKGFTLDVKQTYPLSKEGRLYSSWFMDGKERYNITIIKRD